MPGKIPLSRLRERGRSICHCRRGGVAVLTALLAPLLLVAVAFGIDVSGWYRDSLHLQALADRAALSAGPVFAAGDRSAAYDIAEAVVENDDVTARIDAAGVPRSGPYQGQPRAIEIIVSSDAQHLVAGLYAGQSTRLSARAVVLQARRVE